MEVIKNILVKRRGRNEKSRIDDPISAWVQDGMYVIKWSSGNNRYITRYPLSEIEWVKETFCDE